MDIKAKQIYEKNKKARNVGIALLLFELLCCAVVTLSKDSVVTPISIIKLLLFPIMIVIYIIIYNKFKNQKVFMSAGSAVMIISYIAIVLSTNRTYMYAFIFLVFYYVMIYMDKDFMFRGVIGSSITNIILTIKFILTVEGSSSVVIIQCMFALFGAIACYNCVAISSRHNHETMDAIEENAKNEASLNEKLSNLSDDLANKFEIAKENAKVMTNNMESSNNSVAEISESIKMTAMAIEKQTELTANIQNNLEETEKHTKEMHEAADASATAVKSGKEAMTLLSNQAVLTGELNQRSQKSTEELSERIHDVESFTSEILSISNQTNLLALNASIEAARAGDAGKGFAVVAEEIRQLSDQTKNSVNKITEIISRLVENSNEASESMSQSIIASEKQNKMIDDVISNIDMIEEKNVVLLSLMNNIATEIVKILEDNTQINDSISNLSAMSEEVAASSESSMHVIAESMNSVSNLNSLLGEIYNISQEMSKLTK